MRTLCLYYSRTNNTKTVMETIARNIGADSQKIKPCFAVEGDEVRVLLTDD